MNKIKTYKDFLSKEETTYIVDFAKSIDQWEDGGGMGFWSSRSLNAITIYNNYDKLMGVFLYNLRDRVKETIEDSIRYTISSFWTLDKEYFDGWTIP